MNRASSAFVCFVGAVFILHPKTMTTTDRIQRAIVLTIVALVVTARFVGYTYVALVELFAKLAKTWTELDQQLTTTADSLRQQVASHVAATAVDAQAHEAYPVPTPKPASGSRAPRKRTQRPATPARKPKTSQPPTPSEIAQVIPLTAA